MRAELIASEHFVSAGYYVFSTFGGKGPVDLIALRVKPFEILLLDIKMRRRSRASRETWVSRSLTTTQKLIGVQLCVVDIASKKVRLIAR